MMQDSKAIMAIGSEVAYMSGTGEPSKNYGNYTEKRASMRSHKESQEKENFLNLISKKSEK